MGPAPSEEKISEIAFWTEFGGDLGSGPALLDHTVWGQGHIPQWQSAAGITPKTFRYFIRVMIHPFIGGADGNGQGAVGRREPLGESTDGAHHPCALREFYCTVWGVMGAEDGMGGERGDIDS